MKKFLIFTSGFVMGILATFLVTYLIGVVNQPNDGFPGLTVFPEKGECITSKGKIEIIQVLAPNMALARTVYMDLERVESYEQMLEWKNNIVVLLINNKGVSYYDNQLIDIPANKCARQIGTYQYTTKQDNFEKTVPAVVIE